MGGRTVYLARWRRDGRQVARTFDGTSDAVAFESERRREAFLGAHRLPEPSPRPLEDWRVRGRARGSAPGVTRWPGCGRLPVVPERPRALAPAEVELIRAHVPQLADVAFWGLLADAGLRALGGAGAALGRRGRARRDRRPRRLRA